MNSDDDDDDADTADSDTDTGSAPAFDGAGADAQNWPLRDRMSVRILEPEFDAVGTASGR